MDAERPQVVAHRGSSAAEPEHTRAAYLRALSEGADAVECDVRLTQDGHLVCVHDPSTKRTTGVWRRIGRSTLPQLKALPWDAEHRGCTTTQSHPDQRALLTLAELLGLVRDAGRPVQIAIETKHPASHGHQVEALVAAELARFGWLGDTQPTPARVMSFSNSALRRMHALAPGVPLVALLNLVPAMRRDGSLPPGIGIAGVSVGMLRRCMPYIRRLQSQGNGVHVWTVNDPDDVQRCLDADVRAIITNRPAAVLAQLRTHR